MTNSQIILTESIKLMEEGILEAAGMGTFTFEVEGEEEERELMMPEPIHTFQKWQELGYKVKKGEKAIAQFPIWNYKVKIEKDENGDDRRIPTLYLKTASFFKTSQVEEVK